MTTTTATIRKSTDELQLGDVIRSHGMRVELDRPANVWQDDRTGETVYTFPGLVLNAEEMRTGGPTERWIWLQLHDQRWVEGSGWEPVFTDRWTIQGNRHATWTVEVR